MALFTRLASHIKQTLTISQPQRMISVSPVSSLKQIIERKEGKTLIIEGKITEDPKEKNLFKRSENGACSLCSAGVWLKHTDVLVLSQFLRSDGCIMPRRVTGLCRTQQKRLNKLVLMSKRAGLLATKAPHNRNKEPKKMFGYSPYNTYFDEKTIEAQFYNVEYR